MVCTLKLSARNTRDLSVPGTFLKCSNRTVAKWTWNISSTSCGWVKKWSRWTESWMLRRKEIVRTLPRLFKKSLREFLRRAAWCGRVAMCACSTPFSLYQLRAWIFVDSACLSTCSSWCLLTLVIRICAHSSGLVSFLAFCVPKTKKSGSSTPNPWLFCPASSY